MCPCRFVLSLREPGAVGALREHTRDSVDFPLDSESPNYPRCTLYSPLLPHYCRKMYEKRYDTSFLFPECPRATHDVIISYLPSMRYRTFDPLVVTARDSPIDHGQQHGRRQPESQLRREWQWRWVKDCCGRDVRYPQWSFFQQFQFWLQPSHYQLSFQQILAWRQ